MSSGESQKILWVEDDTDVIGDVLYPIKRLGYKIDVIESLSEFTELKQRINEYCVVVLDLIFPSNIQSGFVEYSGLEALKLLRMEWRSKTPVIVLSVVKNEEILSALHELGISKILFKPVRSEALKETILYLLKENST